MEWLTSHSMTTSRSQLGVLRVLFGLVLLVDLGIHARVLEPFFSNAGIVTNHFALFRPIAPGTVSLLTPFSTVGEVRFAFCVMALVYLAYTLGLFTRAMQALLPVVTISFVSRNIFAEDGGRVMLIILSLWTLALPMGDRFSLDALVRRARRLPAPPETVVSVAMLGILFQAVVVYYFNFAHKTGLTWTTGTAVHHTLWQNKLATGFAAWLRVREPGWFSPLATYGTRIVELVIPALLLSPIRRVEARVLAFGLAVALHGGIALTMNLGVFSYVMIVLMFACLPPEAVAKLLSRARSPKASRLLANLSQLVRRFVQPRLFRSVPRASPWLADAWAAVFLVYSFVNVLHANPAVREVFRIKSLPGVVQRVVDLTRVTQRWALFSPDAPTEDTAVVVDATRADGVHVDPFTGRPPDFEQVKRGPSPLDLVTSDLLVKIARDPVYKHELSRYLRERHQAGDLPGGERLVAFEVWLLTFSSPPMGVREVGEVTRERVVVFP